MPQIPREDQKIRIVRALAFKGLINSVYVEFEHDQHVQVYVRAHLDKSDFMAVMKAHVDGLSTADMIHQLTNGEITFDP